MAGGRNREDRLVYSTFGDIALSNEERLRKILMKQHQADKAKAAEKDEAQRQASSAQELAQKVSAAWPERERQIEAIVRKLNNVMSGGRRLYPRSEPASHNFRSIAVYGQDPSRLPKGNSDSKCEFRIFPTGQLTVIVSNRAGQNASKRELEAFSVTGDQLEEPILDFIELNF